MEEDEGIMVLYGFDLNLDFVHVFDPKRSCTKRAYLESVHSGVCVKLLDGFAACVQEFFEGWEINKNEWKFLYHDFLNTPCSK